MLGITILSHSIRQITGNLAMAIRVSWWFVVISAIWAYFIINRVVGDNPVDAAIDGVSAVLSIGLFVFFIWSISLIAVVWHRYVLLEETPKGIIPYRNGLNVWPYFGYGVGIALLLMLAAALMGIVLGLVLLPLAGGLGPVLLVIIVGAITMVLFFRMALILPSIALDTKNRLTLSEAMQQSRPFTGALLQLAIMLAIFRFVVDAVLNMAFGLPLATVQYAVVDNVIHLPPLEGSLILYQIGGAIIAWFFFMLNITIFTTLYGHIVQKRALS